VWVVRIDSSGIPFILLAAVPAVALLAAGFVPAGGGLLILAVLVALFFRDPDRSPPEGRGAVLAPADGRVLHAGPARPGEAPAGDWLQVTVFLSLFDVHINRAPVGGRVTRVEFVPGRFLAAFRREAYRNEHSEIWFDDDGTVVVARQVVGVLARRVVCRVSAGDTVDRADRIGLMKFGSRMDVFMPLTARVTVDVGARVRAGETVIGQLEDGVA
jgi:phosphatidylserine decarboxylase